MSIVLLTISSLALLFLLFPHSEQIPESHHWFPMSLSFDFLFITVSTIPYAQAEPSHPHSDPNSNLLSLMSSVKLILIFLSSSKWLSYKISESFLTLASLLSPPSSADSIKLSMAISQVLVLFILCLIQCNNFLSGHLELPTLSFPNILWLEFSFWIITFIVFLSYSKILSGFLLFLFCLTFENLRDLATQIIQYNFLIWSLWSSQPFFLIP